MDGTCMCFDGWNGANCNVTAPAECAADLDCGAGRVCDRSSGMCVCAGSTTGGQECEACTCGKFGSEACGAAPTCDVDKTCSGNGRSDLVQDASHHP